MTLYFRGRPACSCLVAWLPEYEKELKRVGVIKWSIDIYQLIGGYVKSGGTHAEGQCADLAQVLYLAIWIARQMGADAGWHREDDWDNAGGIEHAHLNLRGCPHGTAAADSQYTSTFSGVDHGKNGLANGGRDPGPRPLSGRTWREGIAWAKARQKAAEPKLKPVTYYVNVARAYGRSEPNIKTGKVVGSLAFGKTLKIVGTKKSNSGLWGWTVYEGKKRWWIIRYLSKTKPVAPTQPGKLSRRRYMTFNIDDKNATSSGSAKVNALAADIRAGKPAVVGIQEGGGCKAPGVPSDLVRSLAKELGFTVVIPTTAFNENYALLDPAQFKVDRRGDQLEDFILGGYGGERKHVTRVVLTDVDTGDRVPFNVTHLDAVHGPVGEKRRQSQGVDLAAAVESTRRSAGTEFGVVLGDLNTPKPITALGDVGYNDTAGMTDNVQDAELSTFSGKTADPRLGGLQDYDHVYVRVKGTANVNGHRTVGRRTKAGEYAMPKGSDHQPVVADITAK